MLRCENLAITLGDFHLDGASFRVERGDHFVLLGQSGTGKTVILEMIAGLLKPAAGQIFLQERDITQASIQSRSLGLVYQDHALFPHLSVAKNIVYPLRGAWSTNRQRVEDLAAQVGAGHLLDRSPVTLSHGEAQRVALARTLATDPTVLLLDEPMASLDVEARSRMRALLRRLNAAGQTILHVTHDDEEAMALATRVAVLENGRIAQCGTPDEVFHHPRSRFVAHFVGIRNFWSGELSAGDGEEAAMNVGGLTLHVACAQRSGPGFLVVRSEDVTLSGDQPVGSARNVFSGTVVDLEPARLGLEIQVDIGVPLFALLTRRSAEALKLTRGSQIWASWKSTAAKFIFSGDKT